MGKKRTYNPERKTVELTNLQGEVVTIATPRQYNPERIRLARLVKRMKQREVAKALGVGLSAVSGWEAPRDADHARTPTPENLGKLADLLLDGRGVDYFYGQGSPL